MENFQFVEEEDFLVHLLDVWDVPFNFQQKFKDLGITTKDLEEHLGRDDLAYIFKDDWREKIKFQRNLDDFRKEGQKLQNSTECTCCKKRNFLKTTGNIDETILGILLTTVQGKGLLKKYQDLKTLSSENQTTLVECICHFYLDREINLGVKQFQFLAENIVKNFPTEVECEETKN
ncbi:uncharacterized protein LOC129809344 [Phlebotomus papatasi]|uniref:uncharacterized protein LOC129809344 n=1 Tax=Phlebotomus papatasi TaxID=29031 RepID=UPI0024834C4C|nr:uncharacterized protein LOC129809344 [Phlebotomus papatasi]